MTFSLPKAVRTAHDLTVISAVVATHLVCVTTRILVAMPGDVMHDKCVKNARKCHHALSPDDLQDPTAIPAPCCDEVAGLQDRLIAA